MSQCQKYILMHIHMFICKLLLESLRNAYIHIDCTVFESRCHTFSFDGHIPDFNSSKMDMIQIGEI